MLLVICSTTARADQAKLPTIGPSLADCAAARSAGFASPGRRRQPNARDTNGNTPRIWSAVYGDVGLKLLVEAGARRMPPTRGGNGLMRSAFDYESAPAGGTRGRRQPQVTSNSALIRQRARLIHTPGILQITAPTPRRPTRATALIPRSRRRRGLDSRAARPWF